MNSHLTAIARTKPSIPARFLNKKGLLKGRKLDFGCGRGMDATAFKMDGYDPHYWPDKPEGKYDTITCTYVLNTLRMREAAEVIADIKRLLAPGGAAYLTVRRDVKQPGLTSKRTYQWNVKLPLEVVKENNSFCIYRLIRD